MAQQATEADVGTDDHNEEITANFGTAKEVYDRFIRGAEGLYNVMPTDTDGEFRVARDGSDHVYRTNVREVECDCGDKKSLCKHLWRAMMETGELPAIGVNVAANTTTDGSDRLPSEIVLTDAELEQMLVATDILSMTDEVDEAFIEEDDGEHVGELDAETQERVLDTLEMACSNSAFDGPTCDAEVEAAHNAIEAVESAEAI